MRSRYLRSTLGFFIGVSLQEYCRAVTLVELFYQWGCSIGSPGQISTISCRRIRFCSPILSPLFRLQPGSVSPQAM